jgi:hemerythrin superfamily protein
MKIYEALAKDHLEVKELLAELIKLKEGDEETRHDLVADIRDALIPHSRAEESILYNSMRAMQEETGMVMHGYQEHAEAEALLRTLQVADKVDMGWKQTAKMLKEALEHHIEEEEGDIFTAAQELFTADEAEMMGRAFISIKPQIKEESFIKTSGELIMNLLPPRLAQKIRKIA